MGLSESKLEVDKIEETGGNRYEMSKELTDLFKQVSDTSSSDSILNSANVYCDLCFPQYDSVKAAKFCKICNRYLCRKCFESHEHSSMSISKESSPAIEVTTPDIVTDIDPRSNDDKEMCWISAVEILPTGDLVLIDGKNSNVKLCRTDDSEITSNLTLPSAPFDVAVVSKYEIGVTIPEQQKVQYLGTLNGLSKTRRMRVDGHCFGIARSKDLLALTFLCPEKVELISNSSGKILRRIETDVKGNELFSAPYYIVFSNDGKHVYISDHRKDSVMKFTIKGEIIATYRAGDLDRPEALVAMEDGSVIVASRDSNSLHVISSFCNKIKVYNGEESGLSLPWSICSSSSDKLLYVGNEEGKYITVYSY